jgi:hypothetical protein
MRAKLVSRDFARVGAPWRVPSSEWILGESSPGAAIGTALAQAIVEDMIPRIMAWYGPAGIARDLQNPPPISFPGLVPIERAIAMALLEVEEEDGLLARTLSRLPPDDFVRRWIENRSAELARG